MYVSLCGQLYKRSNTEKAGGVLCLCVCGKLNSKETHHQEESDAVVSRHHSLLSPVDIGLHWIIQTITEGAAGRPPSNSLY